MKKFIYAIFAFAVLAFVGCTKEEIDDVTVQPGEAISFGVMTEGTRTVYGSQNTTDHTWPIYWTSTDQIRIFSAQAQSTQSTAAGVAYADYKVNGNGTASKATIAAVDTNKALKWNSEYGVQHTFYATYPGANNNITVDAKGIATFPINRNQICDLESSTDGNYVFKPRMENQYMVATAGENPKDLADGEVWLDFKPVMTTLDIIVNGQAANNYSGNITVTGVSIIMEYNTTAANASTFAYDIEGGHIVASASSSATTNTVSNTIFIGIENGDVDAIELAPGKTLKLTAFVPPVQGVDYTMKVRVHAAGTTELIATLATATAEKGAIIKGTETTLAPSSKAQFTLPVIPNPLPVGNNWITPLANDILLSQLSIPGTHDAGAGEDVEVMIIDSALGDWADVTMSIGSTQNRTIEQQWNMGIRAFDFRPAIDENTDELYIYHGVAKSSNKMSDVFDMLTKKLSDDPDELAVIIIRHENDVIKLIGSLAITGDKDTDATNWKNKMNTLLSQYSSYIATYEPNMTVGDCRGKMLIIDRSNSLDNCVYLDGWKDLALGYPNADSKHTIGGSEPIWLQDYYSPISDEEKLNKINAIFSNIQYSETFDNQSVTANEWMINHCSGYNSGYDSGIMKYISEAVRFSTSNGYRGNAQTNHKLVYDYLMSGIGVVTSGTVGGSSVSYTHKEYGPLGIVLMDFVGDRTNSGYTVYGDILPQAIIDNNYRYTMKRKTN